MENLHELLVPDIGDFSDVPIIEVHVQPGERVEHDSTVVTLESDKASMEVPAGVEGVVVELLVQEGDTVSEGSILLSYTLVAEQGTQERKPTHEPRRDSDWQTIEVKVTDDSLQKSLVPGLEVVNEAQYGKSGLNRGPAGPAVRRLARELGVDLLQVTGSGAKGRISKEDIRAHVKQVMKGAQPAPRAEVEIDFSKFGPVRDQPLSRIQQLSGAQLAGNWTAIPHVTSFDEADITELEKLRKELNKEQSVKLTLLAFVMKAVQKTLAAFPLLNSSVQNGRLVIKEHYHIGFAADTPSGLLVPVIRNVDQKGVVEIAEEIHNLAYQARAGKLKSGQMQGGTFTISSLGSVGGTFFTPIINAPEVGILALGRSAIQPKWNGSQFNPCLILPISLSWDHRALDGVTASRFNVHLCRLLADFRRVAL